MGCAAPLFLLAIMGGSLPAGAEASGSRGPFGLGRAARQAEGLKEACRALEGEYDLSLAAFRRARYRSELGDLAIEHPVHPFWPRFEILAKQGVGRARLWMLTEVQEKNLGAEGIGAWKGRLLGELLGEGGAAVSMSELDWVELVSALSSEGRWLPPRLIEASLRELFQTNAHLSVRGTAGLLLATEGGAEVRRQVEKRFRAWLARATPSEATWFLREAPRILATEALDAGDLWDAIGRAFAASGEALPSTALAEVLRPLWDSGLDRPRLLGRLHRELHGSASAERRLALGEALADVLLLAPRTPEDRAAAMELYAFVQAQEPGPAMARRVEGRIRRARALVPGQPAPPLAGVGPEGEPVSVAGLMQRSPGVIVVYFGDRDRRWKAPPSFAALAELGRLEGVSLLHISRLTEPGLAAGATLVSPDGAAHDEWGVREETAFVFDRAGRWIGDGWLGEELLAGVKELLAAD